MNEGKEEGRAEMEGRERGRGKKKRELPQMLDATPSGEGLEHALFPHSA